MASEKQQPGRSRSFAQKVARSALRVVAWVFLTLLVLGLINFVYDGWYHRTGRWKLVVQLIKNLASVIEIVKDAQRADANGNGRWEYVGWRDYAESIRSTDYETIRLKAQERGFDWLTLPSLWGLSVSFVLDESTETIGDYQVERGAYVGPDVNPRFKLALFIPNDRGRAERTWILVAWTRDKSWFQTLKSFLIVKNEGDLSFHFGRNFPMDSDSRLPDIERLGSFQPGHVKGEEVWRPYPLPE